MSAPPTKAYATQSVDAALRREMLLDCGQVLAQLFYYLDERRYDDAIALFTTDGIWQRGDDVLEGHAAILANLNMRPVGWSVRHMLTNMIVTPLDARTAEQRFYVTAYLHEGRTDENEPLMLAGPYRVLIGKARQVATQSGWKITDLSQRRLFEFQAASPNK